MNILKKPKALKQNIRQRIRDKAIARAQTRILLAGRKVDDFDETELEVIVAEEEEKLYSAIKEKGLLALAAAFGLGWWL